MKKALGLSKFQGDYKGLDYAILKATSYKQALPKEKHIRTIFQSFSPSKPHNEVIYCIHGLSRRLRQTNNWAVALKILIIIHRCMRELDNTGWQALENYSKGNGYLINLAYFRDISRPNALDYSSWIRNYGLYLEECLRCYAIVNYNVGTYSLKYSQKHDTKDLLDQLPALQNLLFRLLDCKPGGASGYNRLIQYALSMVIGESIKLYVAITIRVVELLDKFFEMNRNDAASALEIYRKSGSQAERLSEFFETCRGLDFGRGQKFINIKKPPASFLTTMEEYIKEAPTNLILEYNVDADEKGSIGNGNASEICDILTEANQDTNVDENTAPPQAADLMGLYDLLTGASEFDENSLALAIVPTENSSSSSNDEGGASPITGWEVALFSEPESINENIVSENKETSGSEISKLNNLYGEASIGIPQNDTYHIGQASSNSFDFQAGDGSQYNVALAPTTFQSAYYVHPNMASPIPSQMLGTPYQHYYMMQQQQEEPHITNKRSSNPFDEPNMLSQGMPSDQTQRNYSGTI